MSGTFDCRLAALKGVDIVLAMLQEAFARPDLLDGENPYRYVAGDPKQSPLWICDAEGREGSERSGLANFLLVTRGDFTTSSLHLGGVQDRDLDAGTVDYSDLTTSPVFVHCESRSKMTSEILASVVFQLLKMYRQQLMAEFDIQQLLPTTVTPPVKNPNVTGEPWVTSVFVNVQMQERYRSYPVANLANRLQIRARYNDNVATASRAIADIG